MKEEILKLRNEGKSYNEIKQILGCSKGTISYHCGDGQKEKTKKRRNKRRENKILHKTEGFKYRRNRKDLVESVRKFNKRDNNIKENSNVNKDLETNFNWGNVLDKYTENTKCYLSGVELNLYDKDCQFDHIIPASKGGENVFSNLGICHGEVNSMKGNMSIEELMEWCIKILEFNGYVVNKIK